VNTADDPRAECFVCQKHRGGVRATGGVIYQDDLIYVGHASIPEGKTVAYLGSLVLEPKRHVQGLADLTDAEAQRAGLLITRLSRALRASEGAEHVYLFVLGHQVPHLHVWLVPRYPGTPRQYWGMRVDEWPGAPTGGLWEIAELCERLRIHVQGELSPTQWPDTPASGAEDA
jgi:diadenosine tetraphosphate (Ap4A) HIT family hydrolase